MVYLNPAGRLATDFRNTHRVIGGLFGCDLQRALPGACHRGDRNAVGHAGTGRFGTAVIDHRDGAPLRTEPLERIEADADANRNERAESAVHARAEREPLLRGFRTDGGTPCGNGDGKLAALDPDHEALR
jgi:hypothetical protein